MALSHLAGLKEKWVWERAYAVYFAWFSYFNFSF